MVIIYHYIRKVAFIMLILIYVIKDIILNNFFYKLIGDLLQFSRYLQKKKIIIIIYNFAYMYMFVIIYPSTCNIY